MAYERQYYTNGDVLDARQMNHMETGIKENSDNIDKHSEDIATKASAIKEKASGEVIVVTDSDEAKPLGLAIDGKSEQNQYSGKQLADTRNLKQKTDNGITYTPVNDEKGRLKYVEATGTATAISTYDIIASNLNIEVGNRYIINGSPSDAGCIVQFWNIDGNGTFAYDNVNGGEFEFTNETTDRFNMAMRIESGVTVSKVKFYPMIRPVGTDGTYEPFVGGKPSPSPEYKQEIRNIGVYDEASGKYAVGVKGTRTNLAKIEHTEMITNTSGVVEKNVDYMTVLIDVRNADYIYVSGNFSLLDSLTLRMGLFDEIPVVGSVGKRVSKSENFALDVKNYNYVLLSFLRMDTLTNDEAIKELSNSFMVNYGNTALPWEQFGETTATVLLDEPLRKGDKAYWNGGSKVRIDRYRDVEVFDGSDDEGWASEATSKGFSRFRSITIADSVKKPLSNAEKFDGLCDSYVGTTVSENYNENKYGITVSQSGLLYVCDENYKTSDVTTWKAHLAENPITVEYPLAEPITEEIDIDLGELTMFYPTTILSNDCNANMEVTYIADTKAYIDKKFAELATAMV